LAFRLLFNQLDWKPGLPFFLNFPSILIVLGGTLGATMIHFPLTQILKSPKRLMKAFSFKRHDPYMSINLLVEMSILSKKRGRLFLIQELSRFNDEFTALGIQLVADNIATEEVEYIMRQHLLKIAKRHQYGFSFFEQMAKYAPAFGLLGTLIGLIALLANLSDPQRIGPNMAVALVTTFYGVIFSNLIFLPISGRLRITSAEELFEKEMIIEGVLAIADDEIPTIVKERMELYLSENERKRHVGRE
jgi:chemotaxis protein MotA